MAGKLFYLHRQKAAEEEERETLMGELFRCREKLSQAYAAFDLVSDPDLVEAWTYEISAQRARYHYLIRQIKQVNGECTASDGEVRA
jgi:hypothetical protein